MIAVEYPAVIRMPSAELSVRVRESAAIARSALPESIEVVLRCGRCGLDSRVTAAVEFVYCDDDHYAKSDIGFRARLRRACLRCDTGIGGDVSITVTRHADGSAWLVWDFGPSA